MSRFPGLKLIFSTVDELMAHHLSNVLKNRGFESSVKNSNLADVALPRVLAQFEVWVSEDKFAEAERVLEEVLSSEESATHPWNCPKCGETAEGQFTECWSCGCSKPINN